MASVDVDKLCTRLSSMRAGELYCLDNDKFILIPKIRRLPLQSAVDTIRRYLDAIPDVTSRLRCVCRIYKCLMAKGLCEPWVLYRLGDTEGATKDTFVIRYFRAIKMKHCDAKWVHLTEESVEICALVPQSNTPSDGHAVCCYFFWKPLACVAVYRPAEGYSDAQHKVLSYVLGCDPERFEHGVYNDLDSAHMVATRLASA